MEPLIVSLLGRRVGMLELGKGNRMTFRYDESWLSSNAANSLVGIPLSQSLPFRLDPFSDDECRPFFGGLLPESKVREQVARHLGVSDRNDFAMLTAIGGECAGAVSLVPAIQQIEIAKPRYEMLTQEQLGDLLRSLSTRPLLIGESGVRLSLAGAQRKLAIYKAGDRYGIPQNGAPSTHILKPENPAFPGLVDNEGFCLSLAKAIGLSTVTSAVRNAGGIKYLEVERYDREVLYSPTGEKQIVRLHQEDFCQALAISSEQKYESEGGPSLKQCFHLVFHSYGSPLRGILELLDAVIFNYLIGNCDAHGKNFSLLYRIRFSTLAPLYDLICTQAFPDVDTNMAMKIGGENRPERILIDHWNRLAEEAELSKAQTRIRILEMINRVESQLPFALAQHIGLEAVGNIIADNCRRTRERLAV